MKPSIYNISIPKYKPGEVPDHTAVGAKLDSLLVQHYIGREVVIRCIGSQDHSGLTLDQLTEIVVETGTDKYDVSLMGVGYEEFVKKGIHVDFYGEEVKITENLNFMPQQIWEMHHSAIGDRGYGVHVDLILIYDEAQLDMVMNLYTHHETSDGYTFKDPANKPAALLGVIKVSTD